MKFTQRDAITDLGEEFPSGPTAACPSALLLRR
jgi:hypothetical protein